MKIIKNDKVVITKGKDKGKTANVTKVLIDSNKVIVSGINKYKKHLKPTQLNPQGGISDIELPIAVSNVSIVCTSCNKKTRVGYKILKDKKIRVCKKCGQAITNTKWKD